MTHVLHVINDLRSTSGGAPKAVLELAETMVALGHQATVFYGRCKSDEASRISAIAGGVTFQSGALIGPPALGMLVQHDQLASAVSQADVVILHGVYQGVVLLAARLSRAQGKPYFVMPHCALTKPIRDRKRWRNNVLDAVYHSAYLERAAGLVFTNSVEAEISEFPERPAILLPIGIYPSGYTLIADARRELASRRSIGADHKIILFLGRVTWKKGITSLLQAFFDADLPFPATLLLAGPIDREMLRPTAEALKRATPARQVHMLGPVGADYRDLLYSAADVSVLASHSENYGYSAVESLLYGTPLIVSRGVAIWQQLADTGGAVVCDPLPSSVTAALENWARNLGAAPNPSVLRQRTADTFSWRSQAGNISAAIASMLTISGTLR